MSEEKRIILVEPSEPGSTVLAGRLRMQGFSVLETSDPAEGARLALSDPPAAVVADLWMPSISGVQLCRLLRAEPATEHVPVVLRGPDEQRNRFWAERAGAAAYVVSGRMGDLNRALARTIAATPPSDAFFTELAGGEDDIRDRIAAHLDAALFESVLAAEVRALGTCGAFDRLFDLLSQFVSQVLGYRWLALSTDAPSRFGLHTHPSVRTIAEREARASLELPDDAIAIAVEDDDAFAESEGPAPLVRRIALGSTVIGTIAIASQNPQSRNDVQLIDVVARELAGPMRMCLLVEESQRLATSDPLTGLMNRRAFLAALDIELERARRTGRPLTAMMLDVDHFKNVNDLHGHAMGDLVLAETGKLLVGTARKVDLVARWGGEEFMVVFHNADAEGALVAAERARRSLEGLVVCTSEGERVPVTASFGLAVYEPGDTMDTLVDRADRAMYQAKAQGRNRVVVATGVAPIPPEATSG